MDLKLALGGQEAGVTIQLPGDGKAARRRVNLIFSEGRTAVRRLDFQRRLSAQPSLSNTKQTLEIPSSG